MKAEAQFIANKNQTCSVLRYKYLLSHSNSYLKLNMMSVYAFLLLLPEEVILKQVSFVPSVQTLPQWWDCQGGVMKTNTLCKLRKPKMCEQ